MELVEAALRLLDGQDWFDQLRDSVSELTWEGAGRPQGVLILPVTVQADIVHTLDYCYDLAELMVRQPRQAEKLFQQLTCQAVAALNLLPEVTLQPAQVLVTLRPYNLVSPAVSVTEVTGQLISCGGILLSLTLPTKFLECTRYVCQNSYCAEQRISAFEPGRPPPGTYTDCLICGDSMREDVGCRRISEMMEGFLVPLEALEAPLKPRRGRHQSVRVVFRGDLCTDLHLGGRYRVVGRLVKHPGPAARLTLEAASVRSIPLSIYAQPLTYALSPVIETLYHDRRFSPWSFALSLSYVFGSHLTPAGTYFRLKLGMLLSLVACGAIRHSRLLPLLAVGPDVGSLCRLLSHGASFARRCVRHTCAGPLAGRAGRPAAADAPGGAELEAGSLLLARGGVCLLGDLSKYRKEALQTLQKGLEMGTVSLVCAGSLSSSGQPESVSLPLLCQPWAVFDRKPSGRCDLNCSLVSDTGSLVGSQPNLLPRTLTEAFGIVYCAESADDCDDLACDLATCQLLMLASGGQTDPELIPDQDLQTFLAAACELSLDMEPDAEQLVRRYFVASRRVRTSSNVPDVPVAAVNTISGLAHAFAQLSLRGGVTVDDVTMAVLLYEESLAACFGYSPLDVTHTPHVREADLDANLGRQNDERMRDFQRRLEEFIDEWANW